MNLLSVQTLAVMHELEQQSAIDRNQRGIAFTKRPERTTCAARTERQQNPGGGQETGGRQERMPRRRGQCIASRDGPGDGGK
jgi:hypothetical protein